jgi:hypothetical protein
MRRQWNSRRQSRIKVRDCNNFEIIIKIINYLIDDQIKSFARIQQPKLHKIQIINNHNGRKKDLGRKYSRPNMSGWNNFFLKILILMTYSNSFRLSLNTKDKYAPQSDI